MSRSAKKGPYMDPKLLKKIAKMEKEGRRDVIKTWARGSDISPEMVGHRLAIHNGKQFIEILVIESMVGHKLGEFSPTRKFISHSRKGYIKPVEPKE
ncbi:30S ribosomal protein S19 [Patescibacteria group bacterium]|nr:30S ribosomal protein S19 [Patescibacteria group bacterium]